MKHHSTSPKNPRPHANELHEATYGGRREEYPRPSVVLAHDYLTQRGGAERVALELARRFNVPEIVTSAYVASQTFDGFADFSILSSQLLTVRALKRDPRRALPFLAAAWDSMPPIDADAVICSSSGWAHGVRTTDSTRKIVYCHNPARWLYQTEDFLSDQGSVASAALRVLSSRLKAWDIRAARTADVYVANSSAVARRIWDAYAIDAEVIHPPVSVNVDAPQSPDESIDPGYFLCVSRARGYKGTEKLVEAFSGIPNSRLVIVGWENSATLPSNVVGTGRVSEARLRWLYAKAAGLVSVSKEDFGLTPIEANAFGTPALVIRAGGFLDSMQEGVNGVFIPDDRIESIVNSVKSFPDDWDKSTVSGHAQKFSPEIFVSRMRGVLSAR